MTTTETLQEDFVIRLAPDSIIVGSRMRQDYGDLDELALSIAEQGLIHPLTIDKDRNLIAGGRRFAAITTKLPTDHPLRLGIPCYVKDCAGKVHLRMMELEENLRRKEMDWKERVKSIAEIHQLNKFEKTLNGETWTQKATGELLNLSTGNVSNCVEMDRLLRDTNHPIQKAESLSDAFRILVQMKEDEMNKYNSSFAEQILQTSSSPVQVPTSQGALEPGQALSMDSLLEGLGLDGDQPPAVVTSVPGETVQRPTMKIQLSRYLMLGDCREHMAKMKPESIDHVITDPPYAIDMAYLNQSNPHGSMQNIERTEEEHDVEENLDLLTTSIPLIYQILKPQSFFIFWYDNVHWQFLRDLCEKVGFKVQRWPLVWVKTSRCMNQMAQYNFTKATEFAMVCRKGSVVLNSPQGTNYWIGNNDDDKAKYGHPFVKPEPLWRWLIGAAAVKNQIIYDPFNGVGSCTLAAAKAGYMPMGSEKKEIHYNRSIVEMQALMQSWHGVTHDITFI